VAVQAAVGARGYSLTILAFAQSDECDGSHHSHIPVLFWREVGIAGYICM